MRHKVHALHVFSETPLGPAFISLPNHLSLPFVGRAGPMDDEGGKG